MNKEKKIWAKEEKIMTSEFPLCNIQFNLKRF